MHSFQNFIVRLIPNHPLPLETTIWKLVVRALKSREITYTGFFTLTRKVKVLPLPETIKEKSTFRAEALRRESLLTPDEGPLLETSIFSLSFQVVREPLPFAYH